MLQRSGLLGWLDRYSASLREIPPDHDEDEYEYADENGKFPDEEGYQGAAPGAAAPAAKQDYVTRTDPAAAKVGYTPPGAPMGSGPYMSPEQYGDASSVGPAADIYSLGVFAYQALFGELPPPPSPRLRGLETSDASGMAIDVPALARVFNRALAWSPADRHPTALALAKDLREALEASEREQLRVSTKQWETGGRAPGLLWGLDMLARFERWTRSKSWRALDESELAFIAASQRRARRSRLGRRVLVGLAATVVLISLGGLQLYTSMNARLAHEEVDASKQLVIQLEVEQGRDALRDNAAQAKVHLANAYRRGDHSDGTQFMLARALQSDRAQLARLPARSGHMWSAQFSPAGDTIVTTDDEAAQLWDARTYQLRFTLPHAGAVSDGVFSHDGSTLYTAVEDGTIGVWGTTAGTLLRSLHATGKPASYYRLALSPDERILAVIDVKGATIAIWDLHATTRLAAIPQDGAGYPALAFTADGNWLVATGGADVHVFDTKTWKEVRSFPKATRFSVDPTGSRVATGSSEGDVVIWNIPTGAELRRLRASEDLLDRIAFSADGKQLAAVKAGKIQVWDASTGRLELHLAARSSTASSLEFSPTSHLLVSTFTNGAAVLVDTSLGVIRSVFESDGSLRLAHFAPNGRDVLTTARSGVAKLWNADESYFRWGAGPTGPSCSYDLPSEQRFLSLACPGRPTRVWDVQEGRIVAELPSIIDLHDDWVSVLSAVSATGDRAAIARGRDVDLTSCPAHGRVRDQEGP